MNWFGRTFKFKSGLKKSTALRAPGSMFTRSPEWTEPAHQDNRLLVPLNDRTDYQGDVGACVAFALSQADESLRIIMGQSARAIDPLVLYWETKRREGREGVDEGTTFESAHGVLSLYTQSISNLVNVLPDDIPAAIVRHRVVLLGLEIDEGWYKCNALTGRPAKSDTIIGGHAILACGYDRQDVYVANWWRTGWGFKGYCRLPRGYVRERWMGSHVMEVK